MGTMNLNQFEEKILEKFSEQITDIVFLMIENDKELLIDYMQLIENGNKRKTINSQMAQTICKKFNLENKGFEVEKPLSKLIESYTALKSK